MRTPPNNVEAERAVLGSILLDSTGRNEDRVLDLCASGGIVAESFYDPRNRELYGVILGMKRASKPIDTLTLVETLKNDGKLEAIGGVGYIQGLVDHTPTTMHAEYYIGLLREKHLRRTMINAARKTIEKCFDEGTYSDAQTVLGDTEKSFLEIGANGGKTQPWNSAVEEAFRRIEKMFNSTGDRLEGLSTGLKHLDERLQGLKQSEMVVIAARPSVGKTSLAMNIAESVALGEMMGFSDNAHSIPTPDGGKPHPVLIFSLEMPVEALSRRMIAGRAKINSWRLNRGQCLRNEKDLLLNNLMIAVGDLKKAPIYVDDTASLDVMDLRARARRMKKAHGIELIVIDYLQLCRCSEGARQSRQIEVSMISQQIKAMAKELKIPVVVLSQLSRANEQRGDPNEKPKLSDLRDSGAIEQDADVVFLLRRPSFVRNEKTKEANDEHLAIIDIAKNRNGETGEVRVDFVREFTRFFDRPLAEGERPENFQTSEPPPEQGELYVEDPNS